MLGRERPLPRVDFAPVLNVAPVLDARPPFSKYGKIGSLHTYRCKYEGEKPDYQVFFATCGTIMPLDFDYKTWFYSNLLSKIYPFSGSGSYNLGSSVEL